MKKKKEDIFPAKLPYFLSLGFITHDFTKENKEIIGGASAYSAILARNFGLDSAMVTSIGQDFPDFDSLKGIWLAYQTEKRTTTFINKPFKKSFIKSASEKGSFTKERENINEGRVQYVTCVADRIREETIPEAWFDAEIVYICPVLGELEEKIIKRFKGSMIGVAPQGWLRSVGEGGRIEKKRWEKANKVLPKADFVIASEEDVLKEDIPRYVELSNIFVLTSGRKGAELYWDKGRHQEHIPAFESEEVDATGAGDVFGAAFLLRYYETKDVHKAAIFASCAASFVVEKEGVERVPCREGVNERISTLSKESPKFSPDPQHTWD
uniref:Nucleoside kinase n=1 Tax=Candidatus Methanophaga sp. ANME-1 ERB7 TaxID=2759913 RepID=A0A7G9Z4P8_9EURY|nr:nucleoside kinase [Methanosarcinales archaeon ANME-1 ERB7]